MSTSASEFASLQHAQRRLRLTQFSVDHAADAIFWIGSDFRLIYVNDQAVRSLGYSREELLTKCIADIDPLFPDDVCRNVWPRLKGEGYIEFESVHRRKDGSEFPVWVTSSYYQDDEIELSFSCCRDLSDKKATESALLRMNEELELRVLQRTSELAASEARYQDLYHNAPDMFASIDARTGCIVQCNQTLSRMTGCAHRLLIDRLFIDLFDSESRLHAEKMWSDFLRCGEAKTRWLKMSCCDNELIVSVNMTAVRDKHGAILLARSALRDITELRRAAHEADQHRSELAHVARLATTGEMAAGLAHELNQPLYALNNFAQGAIRRLESGALDKESLLGVLHDMAQESQRAAEIIRSLRRYVGRRETQRASVDLNQSVRQVVALLGMEASQRQTTIELQLAESIPLVSCDAIQIEQVLMNLILNAIEASVSREPSERMVSIGSRAINQRMVQFSVSDRGVGVDPRECERIFDAFFTTKAEGLGLGLTISRRIIEAHGGRLLISSNHGAGVTASFTLPSCRTEMRTLDMQPVPFPIRDELANEPTPDAKYA